jgi:hypothetical protein
MKEEEFKLNLNETSKSINKVIVGQQSAIILFSCRISLSCNQIFRIK